MDINKLFEFERMRDRLKDIDRTSINDHRLQQQLADFDRTQRNIEQFERTRSAALDRASLGYPGEVDRLAKEAMDFARGDRNLSNLDDARKRLDVLDRARARMDQSWQIERDIARFQGLDRRVQEHEYARQRIAEFEQTEKRMRQYDDLQRRLDEQEKWLAKSHATDNFAFRSMSSIDLARLNTNDIFRRAAIDPFRPLNTLQERAATAFALTDREADLLRFRLTDLSADARRRDPFQSIINSRDIFTASERARASFMSEMTASVRQAVIDSATDDEALDKIATLVAEKVKAPPKGMSTAELVMIIFGIVGIVMSLLPALYQIHLTHYQIAENQRSGQEQKEFQEKLLTVMAQIAENTEKPEATGVPYLVEWPAEVKARPSFKSATIDRIPENSRVRVLKVQHKWVFVEYAESLDLETRSGWVSKKYLRRIIWSPKSHCIDHLQ